MRIVVIALAALIGGAAVAQEAPPPAGNITPLSPGGTRTLSRELDLELQLDDARRQVLQLQLDVKALQLELAGARGQVQQLLGEQAAPAIEQANAASKTLNDTAVRALGGDPDKGDTYDRKTKTLKRAEAKP